jgi:hypothetical protein
VSRVHHRRTPHQRAVLPTPEAALIKATLVQLPIRTEDILANESLSNDAANPATADFKTVEDAIRERLRTFYDKRKASGDFGPCGPHDMAPVYLSVLGIPCGELEDERFLGRLRRSGLDEAREQQEERGNTDKKQKGKKDR